MIPTLRCKPGTTFAVMAPGGFRILAALDALTKVLGCDLILTAGTNDHTFPDPHATGEAYDVSVNNLTPAQIVRAKGYLEQILDGAFTVLYELPTVPTDVSLQTIAYVNVHASAPHLHVQVRKGAIYPPVEPPTPSTIRV